MEMTMATHVALSGHVIDYPEPAPKVARFLARVRELVDDPKASEDDVVALVYSRENPILDHTVFPTRGAVTRDVLENPVYRVMTDLLFRKSVAERGLDVERIAREFTVPVSDAAARLDIHESAVRQAIAAQRLASWVKEGRHYLRPRDVEAFQVSARGPRAGAAGPRGGTGGPRGVTGGPRGGTGGASSGKAGRGTGGPSGGVDARRTRTR
jgi:hypothetical protein